MSEALVLGEARNSDDMIAIWRAAKERIGLSNHHCDVLAGFTERHTDKLLGPSASKNFGPLTFTGLNWLFAVKWVAMVDVEQVKVMEQYWEDHQRDASNVRLEPNRVSQKILERAKPHVFKQTGLLGAQTRLTKLTPEHRSKIARGAANALWKKRGRKKTKGAKRRRALYRGRQQRDRAAKVAME